MFSIRLEWKEFNISLPDVNAWVKANANNEEYYTGLSADSGLTFWYSEEPNQDTKDALDTYWTSLDEESDEAMSYVSSSSIEEVVVELKDGIPNKSWDQMSQAERKIVLGQLPTNAELGLVNVELTIDGLELTATAPGLNESLEVEADPSETKYVKVGLAYAGGVSDIVFFEKTTGEYGANPTGYIKDLAEYSVEAAGTELVEV